MSSDSSVHILVFLLHIIASCILPSYRELSGFARHSRLLSFIAHEIGVNIIFSTLVLTVLTFK